MVSKYEQTINQMAVIIAKIDERTIGLANRLYDKDGDIPAIKKHLADINGRYEEHNEAILQNKQDIQNSPLKVLGKKWFWIIVGIVILSVLGLKVSDIREIIGLITGI